MAIDESTSLPSSMGVTHEMMACPMPRVPFLAAPEHFPPEIRGELEPCYHHSQRMWGTWPRYLQMLGHAPAAVQAWMLLDQKLRIDYLEKDPDYVKLEELVIIKTALITQCNN